MNIRNLSFVVTALCSLSFVISSAIGQTTNEYWIGPIGTANTNLGAGTMANPWITPNEISFDWLIRQSGYIPINSTIHLQGGTFETLGLQTLPGWKVKGAGIESTIVQMAVNGTADESIPVIGAYTNSFAMNNVQVSDLTVDCNLQNQTVSDNIQAVVLEGSNVKISNVKAINWGTTWTGGECFVFLIDNRKVGLGPFTNCVIDGCIVGSPAPCTHATGADGFTIDGTANILDTTGATAVDGEIFGAEIRNCFIDGVDSGGTDEPEYFHGISMNAYGGKIDNNTILSLNQDCIYLSCNAFVGLAIENNAFLDVANGIAICNSDCDTCGSETIWTRQNLVVANNVITVTDYGQAVLIQGYGENLTNVLMENNLITGVGTEAYWGVGFGTVTNVTFVNNVVDLNGGNPSGAELYADSTVGFARLDDNTELNGFPLTISGSGWDLWSAPSAWIPIPFAKGKPITLSHSGISATAATDYYLMFVPPNVSLMVTGITVETTAITGPITTAASVSLINYGGGAVISPTALSTGATAGTYQLLSPNVNATEIPAGGVLTFVVNTAATGVTTQTLTVDISGYFR